MDLHQTRGNTAELLGHTPPPNVNIIGGRVPAIIIVAIQVRGGRGGAGGEGIPYIPEGLWRSLRFTGLYMIEHVLNI